MFSQSWTWVWSIHGLGWVGLGWVEIRLIATFDGSGVHTEKLYAIVIHVADKLCVMIIIGTKKHTLFILFIYLFI